MDFHHSNFELSSFCQNCWPLSSSWKLLKLSTTEIVACFSQGFIKFPEIKAFAKRKIVFFNLVSSFLAKSKVIWKQFRVENKHKMKRQMQ